MEKFRLQLVAAFAACCSLGMVSCDKEDSTNILDTSSPVVEVSTMSAWQSQTRSNGYTDMPVLRFKDQQAYEDVINNLKNMDQECFYPILLK